MTHKNYATIFDAMKEAPIQWDLLLKDIVEIFDCKTGTLHALKEDNMLHIKSFIGIPEFLLPKLSIIPIGKGMAGIAAERKEPVEMCNLQTDTSGVARPSAKETKVEGSIALPLLNNGNLYGTLGIAKPIPYQFTKEEKETLMQIGSEIARVLHT